MFNSLYGLKYFEKNAEYIPTGETSILLMKLSGQLKVFIIAGSMCEKHDEKFTNSCSIWNTNGILMSKYEKLHLPDIEGEFFEAGNQLQVVEIGKFRIGVAICFDIRFDELAKLYRKMNCNLLVYPVAFSLTGGKLHAELLARSRALDNQYFTAIICPARNEDAEFVTWGHSMIVDPMGQCITRADENETILYANLDVNDVEKARSNIPIFHQRRTDVYDTIESS